MNDVVKLPRLAVAPLAESDLDQAADFLHQSWRATYREVLPPAILAERTGEHFRRHLERRRERCWLAWLGHRLVGLATASANCVEDLWVAERYRRRGVGSALLEAALGHLSGRGFGFAQAGCEDFNRAAVAFFESRGWARIGSEPQQLTPELRVDALVYSLALADRVAATR
jgi:GNAT superfamily N-acetyltransferase